MGLCTVSGPGCEQPAGWPTEHGVVFNPRPGTLRTRCTECERPVCRVCSTAAPAEAGADARRCMRCARATDGAGTAAP